MLLALAAVAVTPVACTLIYSYFEQSGDNNVIDSDPDGPGVLTQENPTKEEPDGDPQEDPEGR